ncbi:MAG: hypothetical protein JNK18_01155 [Cyclobacteriaceae bacterium]|nr:hypothetical protein [Cyclobacteriaceae bacterium]
MVLVAALFLMSGFLDDVPFKPDDEFVIKFVFTFNKRGEANKTDLVLSQVATSTYDRPDTSPLPFMEVTLELLKKSENEVKVKVIRDNDFPVTKKKITEGMKMSVFSGFVDDIKDQVAGYNHVIYFLDKDGTAVSKIVIEFDEEGFYTVNGKKRGKL